MSPDRSSEVEDFRASFFFPSSHDHLDDESVQAVIDGAKEWIGGQRLSWKVVAANYLRDGSYHAAAPGGN